MVHLVQLCVQRPLGDVSNLVGVFWVEGVVPVAVPVVSGEPAVGFEFTHLRVGDLDACGVLAGVQDGFDRGAGSGRGGADGVHDHLAAGQGLGPPVD